ncbi:transcription factor TAFII-31, partial [Sporormia fimetaria CBS 119925]
RPQDARTLHLVLSKLGVHAYTERVPLQIMDFAYRYMSGVLSDAMAYEPPSTSHHSGAGSKKSQTNAGGPGASDDANISLAAVRTAIASRVANQFSATLPREYWAEMAAERNRIALPRVDREFGLRLPAERYCFTGVGW